MASLAMLPRILRASEAPKYLGMCKAVFKSAVRPYVREFPIGTQGVGFDRLELDAWADRYINAYAIEKSSIQDNNQPRSEQKGASVKEFPCQKRPSQGYSKRPVASGKSTKFTGENEFNRALALVTGKKQSNT